MGLFQMQQVIFPLCQRGIEGDFTAPSSSRKSLQHIYTTSTDERKQISDQISGKVRTTSWCQAYHKTLESVKGHSPATTVDTGIFFVMEQACWRLSIS